MKPSPVHLYDYQKINDIAEIISKYNLLAIPVINNDDVLEGMVVIEDLINNVEPINRRDESCLKTKKLFGAR
jgi:magnesium transporter